MLGCLIGFVGDGGGGSWIRGVFAEYGVGDGTLILMSISRFLSWPSERRKSNSIITMEITVSPTARIRMSLIKLILCFGFLLLDADGSFDRMALFSFGASSVSR